MPDPIEIELKFQLPSASVAAARRALAGASAQQTRLQAVYADTADARLAAAGLALRLRREGERWVQTLKGRGDGLMQRLEHDVDLPAQRGEPGLDPARHAGSAAGAALAAALHGAELQPQYRTDIQRLHRIVRRGGSRIEIAFDEGRILAGDRSLAVCELEFELKGGSALMLLELAADWVARHRLWLDVRTKSERGHRLARSLDEVPAVRAEPLPAVHGHDRRERPERHAYFAAMVGSALNHALPNAAELAGASATPEHLHQLRVALRRLRTALRLFADWSGDAEAARALESSWQPWFRQLGEARDADAIEAAFGPALAAAGAPPPVAAQRAGSDLGPLLRDPAFTLQVLSTMRLLLAAPPPLPASLPDLRDDAAQVLRRAWRAMWRDARDFEHATVEAQHRLRRRLKRLRYASEFVQPLFPGPRSERSLKAMRHALEALGGWNDLQVAQRLCRASPLDERAWFVLGWLGARQPVQLRACVEALKALGDAPRFW